MGEKDYRKLESKNLKIYSNPFVIEDLGTGKKETFKNKKNFDEQLAVYKSCFRCDIDDSEYNSSVNS
jgi:plasmid rolling circle replication initiator protein Rep